MTASEITAAADTDLGVDDVRLEIPAHHRHLRMARLTAAACATDLGFTVDEIEELRLAVDEACALLIEHAPDDARLTLTYRSDGSLLTIDGRCPSSAPQPIAPDPVAHLVLRTTVDDFEVIAADDGATAFRMRKRGAVEPS